MLACRPMLSFALALMAGVVAARLHPESSRIVQPGLAVFSGLAAWFFLTPAKPPRPPPDSLPAGYGGCILPCPGFFVGRGLNRFIIILCAAVFLAGILRQRLWERQLARDALPSAVWFDAGLQALGPMRNHPGETGVWRVPALLLTADGKQIEPVPVRLSGGGGPGFRRGDVIHARVRLDTIPPPAHPGAFDSVFWLERDGLAASLSLARPRPGQGKAVPHVVAAVDNVSLPTAIRRAIDAVRGHAIAMTLANGGEHGGMLAAMLYGHRKDVDTEVRDAFRRAGIGHVLAISGLHVGLVVGLLWWLSGRFGWNARRRAVACLFLSVVYLGLAGGQMAASRATLMAVIHLGGIALGRKSDMLNSLGAAAFFLILANPSAPFDVSFQLSFTAVVFIHMGLSRDRHGADEHGGVLRGTMKPRWRRRLENEAASLARLSVATWMGLFPIIAVVFNQINLIGLPLNLFVIPVMSLVLAGGLLLPWLSWLPFMARLACLPADILTAAAMRADAVPHSSVPCHAPSGVWVFVFYLFVFLLLLRRAVPNPSWSRRWSAGAGIGLMAACAGLAASMSSAPPPAGGRLAVLPSWGFGTVVAEAPGGGIAVVGDIARGGLNEAEWLHYLRRGGAVGVVELGDTAEEELSAFSYHYRISAFSRLDLTDKAALERHDGWLPVPGAPGVDYAVSRDASGKAVWLAVRTGGKSVCVASRLALRQFTWRLERRIPGFDADLICAGFVERAADLSFSPQPRGVAGIRGRYAGVLPPRWFERTGYGMLVLGETAAGYDGKSWCPLP